MFDIFGIRARRQAKREAAEAARLAALQEKKRKYQERKAKITSYLKDYHQKQFNLTWDANKEHDKYAEEQNSVCPKCKSRNVINKVVRTKGEIHGEGSYSSNSSSSHFLFGSSSHQSGRGHSKLDGKLDTLPVNKCKDCGHEWHMYEPRHEKEEDIFSMYGYYSERLFDKVKDYFEIEYDPSDITEECNSLDEKVDKYFDKMKDDWVLKKYVNVPRYMIEYAIYMAMNQYSWSVRGFEKEFGYDEDDNDVDEYSYVMPDELWELVKKIINWKGNE